MDTASTPASAEQPSQAADVSTGSSPVAVVAPVVTKETQQGQRRADMKAKLVQLRADESAAAGSPTEVPQQASAGVDSTADVEGDEQNSEASDALVDNDNKPKSVPLAAFQERIKKLTSRAETARTEAREAKLAIAEHQRVLELLVQDRDRLAQALKDGKQYDPRDEQLARHEMERQAQEIGAKLVEDHKKQVREEQRQERMAVAEERLTQTYVSQMKEAESKYQLADRETIIAVANRYSAEGKPVPSLVAIAKQLHDDRVAKNASLGWAPARSANQPTMTRAPAGNTVVGGFEQSKEGMKAWLAEQRARQQ